MRSVKRLFVCLLPRSLYALVVRTRARGGAPALRACPYAGFNVTVLEHTVSLAHLATETMLVVRTGKKDYYLVRVA